MFNNEIFTTHFKNNDIEIEDIKEYLLGKDKANEDIDNDIDIETTSIATLEYRFSAEVRSWGIKSIYTEIKGLNSQIEWSVEKDYLTDEHKQILLDKGGTESKNDISGVIYVDTLKDKFDFTNEVEFESDGGYHFDMVYINLPKKQIIFTS
jgi:hypothetical protein